MRSVSNDDASGMYRPVGATKMSSPGHETLRTEFLSGEVFASIADAQAQLDACVDHYNHDRPPTSLAAANLDAIARKIPPHRHNV